MQNLEHPTPKNWAVRFFTIWTGQAFSLFGSSLVQFALVWWLTQKTGSATVLATASLFAVMPQILFGLFAGTYVDRSSRRMVMIVSDGLIALVSLILAYLFWIGKAEVWHIYLVMAIRSTGGAFHFPAMAASTSLMVPKDQLARVAGMNQTLGGLVNIIAPPVGALFVAVLPNEGILMIDVVTALLAITPLFFFSIPQPIVSQSAVDPSAPQASFMDDMRAGFRYIVSWHGLLAIALMATLLNFFMAPISALMPLLVTEFFNKGVLEFGALDSFFGIGMIIGGVTLSTWGGFKKKILTSLSGIALVSFGILAIALAPADMFWIIPAAMFFVGFLIPMVNGPLHALLQTIVAPDMQGRVMSLLNSAATAMMPISLLIAGPFSDAFGIKLWFWVVAAGNFAIALCAFLAPAILNVEDKLSSVNIQPSASSAD
jgi:DHA3 family macrolide efflux protein-like MFS transporter